MEIIYLRLYWRSTPKDPAISVIHSRLTNMYWKGIVSPNFLLCDRKQTQLHLLNSSLVPAIDGWYKYRHDSIIVTTTTCFQLVLQQSCSIHLQTHSLLWDKHRQNLTICAETFFIESSPLELHMKVMNHKTKQTKDQSWTKQFCLKYLACSWLSWLNRMHVSLFL